MPDTESNEALGSELRPVVYEERGYRKVGTFFHDDGRCEDVPVPDGPWIGPAGISRRLATGKEPVEASDHEIHRMVAEGDRVRTEHAETWRFRTGELIPLPSCSGHVVRDGKFELWRADSNLATVLENGPVVAGARRGGAAGGFPERMPRAPRRRRGGARLRGGTAA